MTLAHPAVMDGFHTLRFLMVGLAASSALLVPRLSAAEPVTGPPLVRGDLSLGAGGYALSTHDAESDYVASAMAMGPRLGTNVGYAPSRLIRLGVGLGVDFSLNLVEDQGIPATEVDGWLRWSLGPTVGFRFGPKAPLELEVSVAFAQMMVIGSQNAVDLGTENSGYEIGTRQYGTLQSAILYYRPGGDDSEFALHGGLQSGWGYEGAGSESAVTFTGSLLLGVSYGL